MVQPKPARLVRALVLAAVLFLLTDVATGFALAATPAGATAREPDAVLAAPSPGDRASYRLVIPGLDAIPSNVHVDIPMLGFVAEWGPERLAAAPDGTLEPVRPLAATLRLEYQGRDLLEQKASETAYSSLDGHPVSQARSWSSTGSVGTLDSPLTRGIASGALGLGTTTNETGRVEAFRGALGPCGFSHSRLGQAVRIGDAVTVYGDCRADGTASTPYTIRGWTTVGGRRALRLVANGTAGTEVDLDPSLPVPLRVLAPMQDTVSEAGTSVHISGDLRLELAAFEAGGAPYGAPMAARGTPSPQAATVPLTPWGVEEGDLGLAFPLHDAYKLALDPASYPPTDDTSVPKFLAAHPGAYLAYAWGNHGTDAQGATYESWELIWSDGSAMLGKVVAQYPNLLYAQTPFPVDALPPRRVVESMDTSNLEASGVQPFPASNHLPGQMPRLADAWATTRSLLDDLGDGTPNDFGFAILCTSQPCRTASATLYVGRSDLAVAGATSQLQDQESRLTMAAFGDDGALSGMLYLQREQKAPLPILPPASPPPAQPPAVAAASGPANGVWAAPPAAVTTGVGVIAALGGLLYWLWPVLKGAGVGLFSRIEPEELLRQPTRARIHAVIEAQPGIHFHALARASAVGNGALEHHLQKLEKGGLVLVKRATGYTCYFPKGTDRHVAAAAPAIRSDGSRAVLEAVARRPGASSRELAAELGVSPSTVSYHLRRLHQAGLVHAGSIGAQLTGLGQQAAGTGANAPTGATAAAA